MPSTDSTDNRSRRLSRRALAALCVLALGSVSLRLPAQALADGDPASDVLATQPLFLPQDAGVSTVQQAELTALLASAQRRGFAIRVAVIASPTDLGSISELWRQPGTYARFLGQELGLVYRGTLLVVMPNGLGLSGVGGVQTHPSALNPTGQPTAALGFSAIDAVRRLAGASGHPLPLPTVRAPAPPATTNAAPWLAFGAGLLLIALAWMASIRAKPIRFGGRAPSQ